MAQSTRKKETKNSAPPPRGSNPFPPAPIRAVDRGSVLEDQAAGWSPARSAFSLPGQGMSGLRESLRIWGDQNAGQPRGLAAAGAPDHRPDTRNDDIPG